MKIREMARTYLPPIGVIFWALGIATVAILMLWGTGYPEREWAAVAPVLFVSVYIAAEVVGFLAMYAIKGLARYARRVARQYDIPVDDERYSGSSATPVGLLVSFSAAMLLTVLVWGIALTGTIYAVDGMGMPPLSSYVNSVALILWTAGLAGFLLLLGGLGSVFFLADKSLKRFGMNLAPVYVITERLTRRRVSLGAWLPIPSTGSFPR